jgi:hypothetical protein
MTEYRDRSRIRLSSNISPGVYELMRSRVDTFEKLELVVTLHGALHATMTVDDVCRVLKLPRDVVRQAAVELRSATLVELTVRGELHLLPVNTSDRENIDELVRLYREDPLAIAKALGDISMDRIRNMASRAFANAFVFRKKPPKDGEDG